MKFKIENSQPETNITLSLEPDTYDVVLCANGSPILKIRTDGTLFRYTLNIHDKGRGFKVDADDKIKTR